MSCFLFVYIVLGLQTVCFAHVSRNTIDQGLSLQSAHIKTYVVIGVVVEGGESLPLELLGRQNSLYLCFENDQILRDFELVALESRPFIKLHNAPV